MELSTIKDTFDRVIKKQKLSSSTTQEVIDKVEQEIESAVMKMQSIEENTSHKSVLSELRTKLNDFAPMGQLEGSQKELNILLSKYIKLLEKKFNPDISKAYRHVEFDISTLNQIIATHLYRQGQFDLSDSFLQDASNDDAASALKSSFLKMHEILDALKSENLEPALNWAAKHSEQLAQNGSSLELKLHQLQFLEILKIGSRNEALSYARKYLAPFSSVHKVEIQKFMACLLWAGRLDQSPYGCDESVSLTTARWNKITNELILQFCLILGQSHESHLKLAISAGAQGLPTLLKLVSVMAATKKQEWQAMKQLPVPVDLGLEFQFHSIFVCPVLREQASEERAGERGEPADADAMWSCGFKAVDSKVIEKQ